MNKNIALDSMIKTFIIVPLFFAACAAQGLCQASVCCDGLVASADARETFASFSRAADCFFQDNKFDEACACFTDAGQKMKTAAANADYFCALARYRQLKYLEEKQMWDEYFGRGNEYREQITQGLDKAVKSSADSEPVAVYARLLLWQFHKDMEDDSVGEALAQLMSTALAYGGKTAFPAPLKDAADVLVSYEEKAEAKKLYSLYIKTVLARISEPAELKTMGDTFFAERNLELAETVYDAYIQELTQKAAKDAAIAELAVLARQFSFKDEGLKDALYAEKLFQKLEAAAGKEAFTEELLYLRAYNLEKFKDFVSAKDVYAYLLKKYPQTKQQDRIAFKIGLCCAYAAQDLAGAREYFTRLADKEPASAESIASLYHLGFLSQWEDDLGKARAYYTKLLEKAGSGFAQTVALAQARLKEIDQNKLLDNRLRLFLDAALNPENAAATMTKSEVSASVYRPVKGQEIEIRAEAYPPQSGCMQVTLEYLWLGDLGTGAPGPEDSSFKTAFPDPGVKMIGVVITMPSGMLDRNMDLLDVD